MSKALLISSATMSVRAGGAIWLNSFSTVLLNVCSAVNVDCCILYPCCVGVFGIVAVMCGKGTSPVSSQLLRWGMWACMRRPCLCLCWALGWGLC